VLGVLVAVVAVAFVLHERSGAHAFSLVGAGTGNWAYHLTSLSVVGDALLPVLPRETTLNAAATLAAAGTLNLVLLTLAGATCARTDDLCLYWCARLTRTKAAARIVRAQQKMQ
jgi:membrane protein DedA with SNARE-associated domain